MTFDSQPGVESKYRNEKIHGESTIVKQNKHNDSNFGGDTLMNMLPADVANN